MNALVRSMRRLVVQPDFVLAFVLLGAGALGLNVATDYLKLHFHKRAVPLRVEWDAASGIPPTMGKWVQVSVDKPLDPDTEHILATRHYVYRDYVNREKVSEQTIRELSDKDLSASDRAAALSKLQLEHPDVVIDLGITYYTGLVDTVAHIPDRCYIADGFDVSTYTVERNRTLGAYADGRPRTLNFRYINFDDETGRGRVSRNVAYLFHVNGHYEDAPLGVRRSLENLFEPYGYYAKVELMTVSPAAALAEGQKAEWRKRSLAAMEDFLGSLLPQVERCLPDWQAIHRKGAPAPDAPPTETANQKANTGS